MNFGKILHPGLGVVYFKGGSVKLFLAMIFLVIGDAQAQASDGVLTHSAALVLLKMNDIDVYSSGNCSDKTKKNCTSLDGIRVNTINNLIKFKIWSGCSLIVTGGTEVGHSINGKYSHTNGYKIDLRPSPCLDTAITKFSYVGKRKGDDASTYDGKFDKVNAMFYREPNHWDILFL